MTNGPQQDRCTDSKPPDEKARDYLNAIEAPHPTVYDTIRELDRGNLDAAATHVGSIAAGSLVKPDRQRLRRAKQALQAARVLEVDG